jgi:nucleotide-binding universal stress UspA family protein
METHFKHILIPLDGSKLAESALPDAFALAQLSQAEVTLLQVLPPIEHVVKINPNHPIYLDELWTSQRIEAKEYLKSVCRRMGYNPMTVKLEVEMGAVAETIIDYAHSHPIDLIVMATHGRSGLQRWVYGSVADKVLRGADLPVLLVRATSKGRLLDKQNMPEKEAVSV